MHRKSEKNKWEMERKQAEEIRERSMEIIGETMERDGGGKGSMRKSSGVLMEYLRKN